MLVTPQNEAIPLEWWQQARGNFTEVFYGVNCVGDGTEIYFVEDHTKDYKPIINNTLSLKLIDIWCNNFYFC